MTAPRRSITLLKIINEISTILLALEKGRIRDSSDLRELGLRILDAREAASGLAEPAERIQALKAALSATRAITAFARAQASAAELVCGRFELASARALEIGA